MLEQPDLAAAEASWQAARGARREERARARAEREASKRQIVDRFQLQVGAADAGWGGEGGRRQLGMPAVATPAFSLICCHLAYHQLWQAPI